MPTWGVLAFVCLAACADGPPTGFLALSVRRSVDIPRSTGMGTVEVEADRSNLSDAVSVSLENPPAGLTAAPLELPAGATSAAWTLRTTVPIDSMVSVVARSTSGLETRARVHVLGDLVSGMRDESYGDHGTTGPLIGNPYRCSSALGQPDGKLLIMMEGDLTIAGVVLRITDGGALDPGYGNAGIATIQASAPHPIGVMGGRLQPDGKLLVFGYELDNSAFMIPRVWRIGADGMPDVNFRLDPNLGARVSQVRSLTVRADGEMDVFLAAESMTSVARLAADGSLDGRFGIGGLTLPVDHLFLFHELADGNWLGFDDATQGVTFEIVTPDGTQVAVSETVPAPAGSVFVRPAADGFVLAYATATSLPSSGGIVLRLGSDLRLDPSFGESGVASSDFPVEDMSVTSDGKIVIAGDGRLTRLNPDGSPDPTFRNGAAADLLDLVGGVPACHESALIVDGEDRITFPWTNAGNELHLLRFLP